MAQSLLIRINFEGIPERILDKISNANKKKENALTLLKEILDLSNSIYLNTTNQIENCYSSVIKVEEEDPYELDNYDR